MLLPSISTTSFELSSSPDLDSSRNLARNFYGGLGAKANEFLSSFTRFARENSHVIPPGEIMNSLRYSLAVVLQKGNALIIQRAMNKATREANKVAPDHIKRSASAASQRKTFVLKSPKKRTALTTVHRRCPVRL